MKRYSDLAGSEFEEDEHGYWVRFEDHEEALGRGVSDGDDIRGILETLAERGLFVVTATHKAVLDAAEEWEEMWDTLRDSGLEPVLSPEEEALDRAVRALRKAGAA